jgi:NADH-quinone oxidoreductase subunit H
LSSNSNYALLGSLRSAAQMISYEVSIGIILISVLLCVGSLNLTSIVLAQKYIWFIIPQFPAFVMFYISALAETNRAPFDLPEAESELVSGFNTEYSGISFGLFFLAEYSNIILMSFFISLIFLGGWLPIIGLSLLIPISFHLPLKVFIIIFSFIWIRSSLPRYRYDQLILLGWKTLLPLSLLWLIITGFILYIL